MVSRRGDSRRDDGRNPAKGHRQDHGEEGRRKRSTSGCDREDVPSGHRSRTNSRHLQAACANVDTPARFQNTIAISLGHQDHYLFTWDDEKKAWYHGASGLYTTDHSQARKGKNDWLKARLADCARRERIHSQPPAPREETSSAARRDRRDEDHYPLTWDEFQAWATKTGKHALVCRMSPVM